MMMYPDALLRFAFVTLVATAALMACDSGPENYDDCMLEASRTGKGDRQFRKLAEQCKEKFRSAKE
ncbi:MAG: hypothetical protein LW731_10155 [Oxalobacteraceae bacterium]|nr:hypothetical protein [Oxalobacteraceae bacterium]